MVLLSFVRRQVEKRGYLRSTLEKLVGKIFCRDRLCNYSNISAGDFLVKRRELSHYSCLESFYQYRHLIKDMQ